MEKHKCKLCFRSFANGKALGGHMRSHMLNLYVQPKPEQLSHQLSVETESASSASSSSEEEEEDKEDKELLGYGLRENPKKSIRVVDPEFSASVVLQDRESETESSKNPIRRRSKRVRKSGISEQFYHDYFPEWKKPKLIDKFSNKGAEFSGLETEPVSSISETTPEEDVAYCLIMLSRDKWRREKIEPKEYEDEDEEEEQIKKYKDGYSDDDSDHEPVKVSKMSRARVKYRCETCNKVFRSYQALGGHRASHKKIKLNTPQEQFMAETENAGTSMVAEEKIHECPVCFRVFASGQALGGHKRSHNIGSSSSVAAPSSSAKPITKHGETLIDLNLPAPIDEDVEFCQIELSALSDAEFVNPMRRQE